MYIMYVDESGDSGLVNSPTSFFVLTGLVLHELRWESHLNNLIGFRRNLRQQFGMKLREEFHASELINKPGKLARRSKPDRLKMIRLFANLLPTMNDISLINIVVDKSTKTAGYDVFEMAWKTLIQRFENTVAHHNFPGPRNPDERGIIICDHTEDERLMQIIRKLHHHNPAPHTAELGTGYRNIPIQYLIEDPNFRDSGHSYFIQAVDLAAFLLYQHLQPSTYMRKKAGHAYFMRLQPILCTVASRGDPLGLVRL
jgi:hypothetical protein